MTNDNIEDIKEQNKKELKNEAQQQLRKRVLTAAMSAFEAEGIRSVRMDDIAHNLAISKRTIYELFSDKEQILLEGVLLHNEEFYNKMIEYSSTHENVLDILLYYYDLKVKELSDINPQFIHDLKRYPKVGNFFKNRSEEEKSASLQFLQKGKDQGVFRKDIDFNIFHLYITETVHYIFSNDESLLNPRDVIYQMTPIWVRGICTERGQSILEEFLNEKREGKS